MSLPRLRRAGLTLATLLGVAGMASARAEVVVTLREAAVIDGARVVLRDVASVSAAPRALAQRIGLLELGPAPVAHERVVLRRDVLAAHIERQVHAMDGVALLTLHWAGATAVTLQRGLQVLQPARLQTAADTALRDWLSRQPVTRFDIEPLALPSEVQVPSGALRLSVRPLPIGQPPSGRLTLWVDVHVDDRVVRQLPVVLNVRSFVQRWFARTDLPVRSAVDAASFEQRELLLAPPYRPALSVLPPATARLVRAMRAGQALEVGDIGEVSDVTRGEAVTASIRRGLVSVQARGEALQDGRSGQSIQVRIAGATAPVAAQVTGPGEVQVNE